MRAPALLALLLSACVGAPAPPVPAPAPRFDPLAFFRGTTEGRGRLKIVLHATTDVSVHGRGRIAPDGALVLEQRVEQQGKPPRDRRWTIREVSPGRYAGSLSDADGPVAGEATGNRLHLAFPMAGGQAEQWLVLAPDGRSAANVLTVRRFGARVAVLRETIRRTGPE